MLKLGRKDYFRRSLQVVGFLGFCSGLISGKGLVFGGFKV